MEDTMASNLETAKRAYELFQKGDVPTLINEILADDCDWLASGPPELIPWAGRYHGKQEIGTFFTRLGENFEFAEFIPREMLEKGEIVVTIGSFAGHARKTGKASNSDFVHVAKYNDRGRLFFFQDYVDTAAAVAALS
jgi:uncharacterized protein